MENISLPILLGLLIVLLIISAFFSGSEIGMMSLNRYRLRHLVGKKHRAAKRVNKLLSRVDQLLGAILIGNTFANVFASAIATVIAVRLFGSAGILVASVLLTLIILVFAEIMPKTLASMHAQKFAFIASLPLKIILKLLYPLIFIANSIVRGLLWLLRVKESKQTDALTTEELRSVVSEATGKIGANYQDMLSRILDLEEVSVEDVMIPRNEIVGIDLSDDWERVSEQLAHTPHTRVLIFFEKIDHVKGFLHTREALHLISDKKLDKNNILAVLDKPHFIPESTLLSVQLAHFQKEKYRIGLVVDEYGDIQGLVTIEDILEEIVGEFTTGLMGLNEQVQENKDGSFIVDGSVNLRELNRSMGWDFPINGSKTLSGLIVELLQSLPKKGVSLRLAGFHVEVISVKGNRVSKTKIWRDPEASKIIEDNE